MKQHVWTKLLAIAALLLVLPGGARARIRPSRALWSARRRWAPPSPIKAA